MHKKTLFIALSSTLLLVAGCSLVTPEKPDNDPVLNDIEIVSGMTKKNYKYTDSWNNSGIKVNGKYSDGSSKELSKTEYKITFSKAAPKNYNGSLIITAKYGVGKNQLVDTFKMNDINVEDEVYDANDEISKYYDGFDFEKTGSTLLADLHTHSFEKHNTFVQYGDTTNLLSKSYNNGIYESPDKVPGESKTQLFYTAKKTDYVVSSREHVWACADSNGLWSHDIVTNTYTGGGSDLYQIRCCDSKVNTARGDASYVCFDDSEHKSKKSSTIESGDGGTYKLKLYGTNSDGEYAKYAEPANCFKGDIARTIAYLYMHYSNIGVTPSVYRSMVGTLSFSKVLGYSESRAIAVLKQWNELDPVSEIEKNRNHTIQQIQGNRNPFVDFPDLINKVF